MTQELKEEVAVQKDKAIKKEIKRLQKIFSELDENSQKVAEGLIEEVAFMRVTLKYLKQDINETGTKEEMPQGNYSILRTNPDVQTYNTMIQRYTASYKELFNLLPKEVVETEDVTDEFKSF